MRFRVHYEGDGSWSTDPFDAGAAESLRRRDWDGETLYLCHDALSRYFPSVPRSPRRGDRLDVHVAPIAGGSPHVRLCPVKVAQAAYVLVDDRPHDHRVGKDLVAVHCARCLHHAVRGEVGPDGWAKLWVEVVR